MLRNPEPDSERLPVSYADQFWTRRTLKILFNKVKLALQPLAYTIITFKLFSLTTGAFDSFPAS